MTWSTMFLYLQTASVQSELLRYSVQSGGVRGGSVCTVDQEVISGFLRHGITKTMWHFRLTFCQYSNHCRDLGSE